MHVNATRPLLSLIAAALACTVAGCSTTGHSTGAADDSSAALGTMQDPATTAPALESFTQDLPGTALAFDMVAVEAGSVTIGEAQVTVGPFWVATTETTWDTYDVFVFNLDEQGTHPEADAITRPSRPYVSPDRGYGHAGFPVISESFKGAQHYCMWLSAKTGKHYRLPTEAEWKLICARSGIDISNADDFAWYKGNTDRQTKAVAQKQADALGLHDLWGNVMEWVVAHADGKSLALGGSFQQTKEEIGCGFSAKKTRDWQMTDPQIPKSPWWLSDADFVGFRVVCDPNPPAETEED